VDHKKMTKVTVNLPYGPLKKMVPEKDTFV